MRTVSGKTVVEIMNEQRSLIRTHLPHAVNCANYGTAAPAAPEGIHQRRWNAMIASVLGNGYPDWVYGAGGLR